MDTAQELAAFLRSRRERLDPGRMGLPSHRRARRTPGLRREEVAELAGVSTDYVVRLEQGRGLRPCAEVLGALPEDRELSDLIAEFVTQDEDFARLWTEREVSVNGRGRKLLRHPVAGAITVDFEVLLPLQDPGLRLIIYRTADEESRASLERLCATGPQLTARGKKRHCFARCW
ncbi:helix-turn-helix domain-containing protein [Streptomyces hundungensis]|uniref:MmyB family transcriptional regulator n=1 Tax=Streptomyces hundungensis TaxID=1077946 RepID=UPI0034008177